MLEFIEILNLKLALRIETRAEVVKCIFPSGEQFLRVPHYFSTFRQLGNRETSFTCAWYFFDAVNPSLESIFNESTDSRCLTGSMFLK